MPALTTISCKEDSSGGIAYSQNNNTLYPRCSGELGVRFLSSAIRKHRRQLTVLQKLTLHSFI